MSISFLKDLNIISFDSNHNTSTRLYTHFLSANRAKILRILRVQRDALA